MHLIPYPIHAAIFDVDGMLLDSKEYLFRAFEHTLSLHGHVIPSREVMSRSVSQSLEGCYHDFAPSGNAQKMLNDHHQFQNEQIGLVQVYDAVHELLTTLQSAGIHLAVFSNRTTNVIPTLDHAELSPYFEAIIHGGIVNQLKPHPEGIILALKHLQVDARHAAMLGDSPTDIQAGKAAGVAMTVGITHGFGTRAELEEAGADYIVDHVLDIPPILLGASTTPQPL